MLKQHLSQRLLQKLSPQQIQLMKLLQIPTAILDQRIKEELEQNPALEEGNEYEEEPENFETSNETQETEGEYDQEVKDYDSSEPADENPTNDFEEYLNNYLEDDTASYKYKADDYTGEMEEQKSVPFAVESTFHDHLERQIGRASCRERV